MHSPRVWLGLEVVMGHKLLGSQQSGWQVCWHSAISAEGWSTAVSRRPAVWISHLSWPPASPWPDSTWGKMPWETQELERYVKKPSIHNVSCRNWGKCSWCLSRKATSCQSCIFGKCGGYSELRVENKGDNFRKGLKILPIASKVFITIVLETQSQKKSNK